MKVKYYTQFSNLSTSIYTIDEIITIYGKNNWKIIVSPDAEFYENTFLFKWVIALGVNDTGLYWLDYKFEVSLEENNETDINSFKEMFVSTFSNAKSEFEKEYRQLKSIVSFPSYDSVIPESINDFVSRLIQFHDRHKNRD